MDEMSKFFRSVNVTEISSFMSVCHIFSNHFSLTHDYIHNLFTRG